MSLVPRVGWYLGILCSAVAVTAQAQEKLEYNRDVRPILAENCFSCHGPDSASRKGDLRIDRFDDAVKAKALKPGKPEESEAWKRILSTDPDEQMPPPKSHKKMTAAQKATIKQWITEGAEYQRHWSLIAPVRPKLPTVKNQAWCRNPIDHFILAKLEAVSLAPNAEADRRTLARRLSLDITGLPPDPADVEAFVNDKAPDAYEKLIDKWLALPQWGEHRGRYWLDAARYADTHGIHFDNYREMYSYRDWVIGAFNRNLPFDQFTIENLAGDLLPNRTLDQQVGSGFNRCNITTNEGGIIDEEYVVLYARDRTETTCAVWLATTANCCPCHDHKFDPLTSREFYQFSAFFNNTTQGARDGNIKDTPPVVQVVAANDRPRFDELAKLIPEAKAKVDAQKKSSREDFDKWLAGTKADAPAGEIPTKDLYVQAAFAEGSGDKTKVVVDGKDRNPKLGKGYSWQDGPPGAKALQPQGAALTLNDVGDFEKEQAYTCAAWVKAPANDSSGAICARMDDNNGYRGWDFWMQARRFGSHIIHKWSDDALKVVGKNPVKANEWVHVTVTYDGSGKAAGVKVYYDGHPQETAVEADSLKNSIKTTVPFKVGQRHKASPISGVAIHDLRVYKRALSSVEIETLAGGSRMKTILAKAPEQRTAAEKNELYPWWLETHDPAFKELTDAVKKLEAEQTAIKARGTVAHVMQEKESPPKAFVLFRGEYDKRRDEVKPATPAMLPPLPENMPRNRLGLAQWLLLPEQPLTARVTVNRYWQELFGTGIVKTAGDFGVAGELPSHPELLDWLAVEFRESGWDIKKFFKLMFLSAAYRQAATATPEKLEKDSMNRLLARGPRFRMDAEMVRDYALAASGLLVKKIGGASVKPYQPEGVWEAVAMNVSNTRSYKADTGENLYRRSMYTFWKRAAPPASMEIFNAPNRETCTVRRERTNTPLQALVTLNDPQYVEAARALAQQALKLTERDDAGRLDYLAQKILLRPLQPVEAKVLTASLAKLVAHYTADEKAAQALVNFGESKPDASVNVAQLASWTLLVNELFNLDEVVCK